MAQMKVLADAKLARIESDAGRARLNGVIDFERDHGNLLIKANRGGVIALDIGWLHEGDIHKSSAATVLQHAAPDTMQELVRGYRAAKKAGLI